jgi:hypothetical protein
MRWRKHVHRCVSVLETDGFTPGIPARFEVCKVCFTAHGFVINPPCFQPPVSSLCVCGAADAKVSTPYGGMSMC